MLLFAGIFLVGLVLVILALLGDNPFDTVLEIPTRPTEIVEATNPPVPTNTVEPSATPEPPTTASAVEPTIEATAIIEVASVTQPPAISVANMTATALVFVIQTEAASTPTLTNTPRLTMTPTPEPLFFDDFTGGMSEQWTVEFGSPFIVDSVLNFSDNTRMFVGDSSWIDYIVSFDVSANTCYFGQHRGILIGVRVQDASNMVEFSMGCGNGWNIIENGTRRRIPSSQAANPPASGGYHHIELVVDGNTFKLNGGPEFIFDGFPNGGVVITETSGPYQLIDNFMVVTLP